MAPPEIKSFLKAFDEIALHKNRHRVFDDFVMMASTALQNSVRKSDAIEQKYLDVVGRYEREDVERLARLFALLVELLEPKPRDFLGEVFMRLELGNKHRGQFFTPSHVSDLMADLIWAEPEFKSGEPQFVKLSEPACGAGGAVLSYVRKMIECGHDPSKRLWAQCIDVDALAARMCFIQLSLWNVPAQVIIGNTLRWEFREVLYTPAHVLFGWDRKLSKEDVAPKPQGQMSLF